MYSKHHNVIRGTHSLTLDNGAGEGSSLSRLCDALNSDCSGIYWFLWSLGPVDSAFKKCGIVYEAPIGRLEYVASEEP